MLRDLRESLIVIIDLGFSLLRFLSMLGQFSGLEIDRYFKLLVVFKTLSQGLFNARHFTLSVFILFENSFVHILRLNQFALIFSYLKMSDVDGFLLGIVSFFVIFQKLNLALQKHLEFFLFKTHLLVASWGSLNLSLQNRKFLIFRV